MCWLAIVVLDGPGHVAISMVYPYKRCWCCELDCYTLFTPISAPGVCLILAKSGLLSGGWRLCWAAMMVQDGQGHVSTSMLYLYNLLVSLWRYGLAWNTLNTHIPSLSTVSQIWAQESGLLPGRCRVYWPDIVVLDGPGHVAMSMLHQCKVSCNLVVLWTRLVYPLHTHYSPKCVPNSSKSGLYCREGGDYIRRQWWSKMVRVMLLYLCYIHIESCVTLWWYGSAWNTLNTPISIPKCRGLVLSTIIWVIAGWV